MRYLHNKALLTAILLVISLNTIIHTLEKATVSISLFNGEQILAYEQSVIYNNNKIRKAKLAEDATITIDTYTYTFMKDTVIKFYNNESPRAGTIKDVMELTIKTGTITLAANTRIRIHKNGRLKNGSTTENYTAPIAGELITFTSNNISFYDDGSFQGGYPVHNTTLKVKGNTYSLENNSFIELHRNGALKTCVLAKRHTITKNGKTILVNPGPIFFFDTNEIKSYCNAKRDKIKINNKEYLIDTGDGKRVMAIGHLVTYNIKLWFIKESIRDDEYEPNFIVNDYLMHSRGVTSYYNNGQIEYIALGKPVKLNPGNTNYHFQYDTPLGFYKNGTVKFGYLSHNTKIEINNNKILIEKGKPRIFNYILFDKKGNLISAVVAVTTNITDTNGNKLKIYKGQRILIKKDGSIITDDDHEYFIEEYKTLME